MKEYLLKIIREALWDTQDKINDHKGMNLKHTADLARLIIDAKNDKLSFNSRDFLMRMNIHPNEFITKDKK